MNKILAFGFALLLQHSFVSADKMKQQGFEYSFAEKGDWVVDIQPTFSKNIKNSTNVSWLLTDSQLLMKNNQVSYFNHYAVSVNSESGLTEVSEISIYFQPDFQTLEINFVKRHRNGKTDDVTKQADIRLLQREESFSSGIYDGGVTAILLLEDVQVGDTVEYAYTVNGRNPIFGQEYFASFSTSWSIPVGRVHIRYVTDKPVFHQVVRGKEERLHSTSTKGEYYYIWDQSAPEAIYDEGDYPHWYNPYGVLRFSQYKSWKGVIDWAIDLYKRQPIKNPELLALATKWSKESKTKKDYAEKVIKYAQNNIRYFGIEIGQNSHLPYDPDTVFGRKFGDCKDKATLINSLLAMEDIIAYPALVSSQTGRAIKDRIPQPGAFDHVISTFNIDGTDYWIDGTRQFQFGSLDNIGISDFQHALVISPGNNSLTRINQKPKVEEIVIDEVYTSKNYLDPVSLKVKFKYKYSRAESMRRNIETEGLNNFSKGYRNYYAKQYPQIELLGNVVVEDDQRNNQLDIYARFKIPEFWKLNKNQYEVAMYGDLISSYIAKPNVADRTMPLANYIPIKLKHTVEVNYGHELAWELEDKDLTIATKSVKYHRLIEPSKKGIKISHTFDILQDSIASKDVQRHIAKTNDIRKAIYYSVTIPKQSSLLRKNNNLKNSIRELLKRKR